MNNKDHLEYQKSGGLININIIIKELLYGINC